MEKKTFFYLVAVNLLFLISCSTTTLYDAKIAQQAPSKTLKVACSPDFPPLLFKKDAEIVGFEADLLEKASEISGVKFIFVEGRWEELFFMIETQKADFIMSGLSVTSDRMQKGIFSEPYLKISQIPLIRGGDFGKYVSSSDILSSDAKFGVINGSTGEQFVKEKNSNVKLVGFDELQLAVEALLNHKIDIVIADAPAAWALSSSDTITLCAPLTEENIAFAALKNNQALIDFLNALIKKMRSSGTLDKINDKWIPNFLEGK
jgi:polar amino acid transport system substrate-binding protein